MPQRTFVRLGYANEAACNNVETQNAKIEALVRLCHCLVGVPLTSMERSLLYRRS